MAQAPLPERAPKTTAPAEPPRPAVPQVEAPDPQTPAAYYANCAAARAAGAAPLLIGQPGYRAPLDRDHDGVACET